MPPPCASRIDAAAGDRRFRSTAAPMMAPSSAVSVTSWPPPAVTSSILRSPPVCSMTMSPSLATAFRLAAGDVDQVDLDRIDIGADAARRGQRHLDAVDARRGVQRLDVALRRDAGVAGGVEDRVGEDHLAAAVRDDGDIAADLAADEGHRDRQVGLDRVGDDVLGRAARWRTSCSRCACHTRCWSPSCRRHAARRCVEDSCRLVPGVDDSQVSCGRARYRGR